MSDPHLHLEGAVVDHPEWVADQREEPFDAIALERAIVEARRATYEELRALAPA